MSEMHNIPGTTTWIAMKNKNKKKIEKIANLKSRLGEAAIGGLLGGGVGAGIGAGIGSGTKDKKTKKPNTFKGALKGGLIGAGAGALGAVGLNQAAVKRLNLNLDMKTNMANKTIRDLAERKTSDLNHLKHVNDIEEYSGKLKEDILRRKKNIYDRHKGDTGEGMFGDIFGKIDDLTDREGYSNARNKKSFAEDVAQKYRDKKAKADINASEFKSNVKKEFKENKADYNKQKSAGGFFFHGGFSTKSQDHLDAIRSGTHREALNNAIKDNFIKNDRYKNVNIDNNKMFAGFRNTNKDTELAKKLEKDMDLLRDSGRYKYSKPEVKKNIAENLGMNQAEADKKYRKILRDARDSSGKEYKDYKTKEKTNPSGFRARIDKKIKEWEERAKASGNEHSDKGYYNRSTGRTNKNHEDLLNELNAKEENFKTKKDVSKHYRELAKKFHPDVNKAPDATQKFQKINNAMDNLKTTDWYDRLAFYKEELMEKVAKQKDNTNDPFRAAKSVAVAEVAGHTLGILGDVGAAGLAAAGGFKGLKSTLKNQGLFKGLNNIRKSPRFLRRLKAGLAGQKYMIPLSLAASLAFTAKAFSDDLKHREQFENRIASENSVPEADIKGFVKRIKSDKRPDSNFNKGELNTGRRIEHEHTSSTSVAKHIAKDHLSEFPNYYTALGKMEDSLKKSAGFFNKTVKSTVPEFAESIANRLGELGKPIPSSGSEAASRLRIGAMNPSKALSSRLKKVEKKAYYIDGIMEKAAEKIYPGQYTNDQIAEASARYEKEKLERFMGGKAAEKGVYIGAGLGALGGGISGRNSTAMGFGAVGGGLAGGLIGHLIDKKKKKKTFFYVDSLE